MTKSPKGWFQAKIPKKAVSGKSIQFYFEGRNAAGKPVVANGGADSPNIVLVVEEESKGEVSAAPHDEDENPLEDNEGNQRPRLHLGHVDKEREGLDTRYGKRKWWIGIGDRDRLRLRQGQRIRGGQPVACPRTSSIRLQSHSRPGWPGPESASWSRRSATRSVPAWRSRVAGRLQYTAPAAKYADFTYKGAIGVMAKLLFYTKQSQLRFFTRAAGGRRQLPLPRLSRYRRQQRVLRFQGHHRRRTPPGRRGRRPLLRGVQAGFAGHRDQRDRRFADVRPRHRRQLRAPVQYLFGAASKPAGGLRRAPDQEEPK